MLQSSLPLLDWTHGCAGSVSSCRNLRRSSGLSGLTIRDRATLIMSSKVPQASLAKICAVSPVLTTTIRLSSLKAASDEEPALTEKSVI
jgi:hypothetical protein